MKVSNCNVYNFPNAIKGMRNPLNSWSRSDTICGEYYGKDDSGKDIIVPYDVPKIGENDLNLMQRLCKSGSEHRKFLRQIFVSMDIEAPLYWWKQMDQYKIGTTTNSQSTMHKLASTKIQPSCFDHGEDAPQEVINFLDFLERERKKYVDTKDMEHWNQIVRWLPEGWLQTRTWTANYEVLRSIYHQRKNHKIDDWHEFCDFIKTLPYAEELIITE